MRSVRLWLARRLAGLSNAVYADRWPMTPPDPVKEDILTELRGIRHELRRANRPTPAKDVQLHVTSDTPDMDWDAFFTKAREVAQAARQA